MVLCNAKLYYIFLGLVTTVISGLTIFGFPMSIFDHFHNKIVLAQRNTHSIQISYSAVPNNCFLEGNFYLCVENDMRVLVPFFLHITAWCRFTLHEIDFR